ncbi:MAG: hypothetical protein ACRDHZ_21355, partial [Ktedonobacteraceae bacterium]
MASKNPKLNAKRKMDPYLIILGLTIFAYVAFMLDLPQIVVILAGVATVVFGMSALYLSQVIVADRDGITSKDKDICTKIDIAISGIN